MFPACDASDSHMHATAKLRAAWQFVRVLAVVILLLAAGTKMVNVQEILSSEGLLSSKWLLFSAIGGEITIALLIFMLPTHAAWLICLLSFSVLALVSGYAFATQQNCQCFGSSVPTHYMLLLDLSLVGLSLAFRPGYGRDQDRVMQTPESDVSQIDERNRHQILRALRFRSASASV